MNHLPFDPLEGHTIHPFHLGNVRRTPHRALSFRDRYALVNAEGTAYTAHRIDAIEDDNEFTSLTLDTGRVVHILHGDPIYVHAPR